MLCHAIRSRSNLRGSISLIRVMSKRKLIELVEGGFVDGWDDPRMNTLAGVRRRGYTPESIRLFAERIGVSKADSWIDMSVLEDCLREDLNERAPRRIAVLEPLKVVIDNYPENSEEECLAPNHPQKPELGNARSAAIKSHLYRARRFHGNAAQGLFPPLARRRSAVALCLYNKMHGCA